MSSPCHFLAQVDDSTPGGAVFHLPFLLGNNDMESIEQVLHAAERHISFLRFSSFLSHVAAVFPEGIGALSLHAESMRDFGDEWVEIRVTGWRRDERGKWEPKDIGAQEVDVIAGKFPQVLMPEIEQEAIKFVNEHAQRKTPEEFRSLAVAVWPPLTRTHIVSDQLSASLDAAGQPSGPRPRF